MDFSLFGIGFPQLMLIFIIGLIVFGPERLPGMARQAGRLINELRRLTQDARGEISSLTKELDIREDLNSVKNDLLSIRNDLTATAAGVTKDFESIRKDITLKNDEGETMGAQREQYTYKVTDAPNPEGSDAVRVEETITRETIIQDAIEDTPATATEVVTDLSASEITPALDGAAETPALEGQALRTILPATPMNASAPDSASGIEAPNGIENGDLTATETVTITSNGTEPDLGTTNGIKPARKSNAGVPLLEIEPSKAANPFAVPYDMPEPEPEPAPAPEPEPALASTPVAWAPTTAGEWEENLAKTRQEFNERLDQMERQLTDRLDRVEKLLASQFLRAHQE